MNAARKKRGVKVTKSVAFTEQTWEKLDKLAEKSGRSRNNYIEQIIHLHLAQTKI